MPDLTNALLVEWEQILTDTLQNFVESLPRRVAAVLATRGNGFRMGYPSSAITSAPLLF